MTGPGRSIRNTAKNISLVVLVVLLRAITYEDMKLIPKGEKLARILHIK